MSLDAMLPSSPMHFFHSKLTSPSTSPAARPCVLEAGVLQVTVYMKRMVLWGSRRLEASKRVAVEGSTGKAHEGEALEGAALEGAPARDDL